MFDIFVVVCKDDFPLLKVLGRSINKFCNKFPLNQIVIVSNNQNNNMSDAINSMRLYFGSFNERISIHDFSEIYDGPWVNGYNVQQILKLYAYKLCHSENIMILDAKNFFINPVRLEEVMNSEGKLRAVYDIAPEFWLENKIFTHKLFELPPNSQQIMLRTPFFIKRQTLIECVDYIKENFNLLPQDIIGYDAPNKTNEFMLIQSFILKKYSDFKEYFFFTDDTPQQGNYCTGIWPVDVEHWEDFHWTYIPHTEVKIRKSLMQAAFLDWVGGIFCSSVHYRSIRIMSEELLSELKNFWIELELCYGDEATKIINDVKNHV